MGAESIIEWQDQLEVPAQRFEYTPGRFYCVPATYAIGHAVLDFGVKDEKGRPIGCALSYAQLEPRLPVTATVQITRNGIRFGAVQRETLHKTIADAKAAAERRARTARARAVRTYGGAGK